AGRGFAPASAPCWRAPSSQRVARQVNRDSGLEVSHIGASRHNRPMDGASRMVFLGFGKYARADPIYAVEPITGDERGGGRRTRVWVEGIPDPVIAARTERTILHEMGHEPAGSELLDEALAFA